MGCSITVLFLVFYNTFTENFISVGAEALEI